MPEPAELFLAIGGMLFLGMATDMLGKRTFLPRVSLLIVAGIAIGPEGLDLIPSGLAANFELVTTLALLMIGFLLGSKLTRDSFGQSGKAGVVISFTAAAGTALMICGGLVLLGIPVEIALLLGCIGSATEPAATVDIVTESGQRNPFTELLLMIVALDDIWGLILFSLALAGVSVIQGLDGIGSPLLAAGREIGGGIAVGLAVGLPGTYLTGRMKPGQPMLTEAMGLAFICGGLAIATETSFIVAAMVMGAVIANLANHHEYAFHEIENIEWPFLIIFFLLAGASLELHALLEVGMIGIGYMALRALGKIVGAAGGAELVRADSKIRNWMGLALMPQAGIAIGMALLAAETFPEYRDVILPVVIGATVVFEVFGPLGTRLALFVTRDAVTTD